VISPALFAVVQCPDCGGAIAAVPPDGARCTRCARLFDTAGGILDLRPREAFSEQTRYLDATLHQDARHETIAPPLLGSKIRHDMLRKFLALAPGDRALDLGCGSGRTLAWSAGTGAQLTGADIAPYFAREAIERFDLVLADLRRLPVRDGAFTKAWSLDVLEHLSRAALEEMLREANRVLADRGALFVYTHVRKNGWPAIGVRAANGLARLCERLGLLDLRQERLRKSDHVNPLADHDDLARVVEACGFRLERVTYYTPVVGAFIENVLVRIAERILTAREKASGGAGDDAARRTRASAKARVRGRGATYGVLVALSAIMKLDLLLFGRIRSGPFFALLRKVHAPARAASDDRSEARA
jgi:SAM-dependent methyltransferase